MALRKTSTVTVAETISNVSVNVIYITEDKLINILTKHISDMKKNHDWLTALALFITLLGVALTADFKGILGMTADMVKGFVYALTLGSFAYFVYVACSCWNNKVTVDDIVKDIEDVK